MGFFGKYVRHHQSWSVSSGELISVIIGVQMFHLLSPTLLSMYVMRRQSRVEKRDVISEVQMFR